jgi:tetratricopeptide (TPR) repeat protein
MPDQPDPGEDRSMAELRSGIGAAHDPARIAGRGAELRELRSAAEVTVAQGRGWVGLIGGEPGIGKTRLASALAAELSGDGFGTAWVSCPEDAGAPPFWPWTQLLGQLGAADALRAGSGESDPELARFLLFEAVVAALRTRAAAGPVLLVLDDLHWADPGSRRLLGRVRAELTGVPAVVLGTYRDTEPGAEALCAEVGPERHLTLTGLAPDDLDAALLAATGERVTAALLTGLHSRTGGNPFFAAEAVRLLRSEGRLHTLTEVPAGLLPGTVRAVLERRLARLPAPAHDLLRVAALLGEDVAPDLLAEVAGSQPATATAAVEAARSARLLIGDRFAHPLVRETLEAQLGTADRLRWHAAAGAVLARRHRSGVADPAAAARHLLAAARLGGDTAAAVEFARLAATEAVRRLGYEDAVRLLTEALAVPPEPEDRAELLCELAEAALAAGDPERARAAYTEAAAIARRTRDPELLAAAALGLSGGREGFEIDLRDPDRAAVLTEALETLPPGDSGTCAAVLARLSLALSFTGADTRRGELSERAVAMARRLGDPGLLAAALAARCDAVAGPDHLAERTAAAAEIIELARAAADRSGELLGRRLRVVALAEAGQWTAVDAEIASYARLAERLGQPRLAWYVPLWRGARALMRGDQATALACAAEVDELGERAGSLNARLLGMVQRFVRLMAQGELDTLHAEYAAMLAMLPDEPLVSACSQAFLQAHRGRPGQARRYLERVVAGAAGIPRDSEWVPAMVQAGVAAVLSDHRPAAELVYRELSGYPEQCAIEGILAGTWGSLAAHLGLLARYLGHPEQAAAHFTAAAELDAAAGTALAERTRLWATAATPTVAVDRPGSRNRPGSGDGPGAGDGPAGDARGAGFRHDGDVWTLRFAGQTARLRDSKGLRDLAVLLSRPGEQTHVTELAGAAGATGPPSPDTGVLADRRALAAYRDRLRELDAELDDADELADRARAERLTLEREALLAELGAVTGLGGRPRVAGSDTERMRKAVTNRIRQAVERIDEALPELGRHLRASVHTGTWCRYDPEHPVDWQH